MVPNWLWSSVAIKEERVRLSFYIQSHSFFLSKNGGMDIFNFNGGSVLEPPLSWIKKKIMGISHLYIWCLNL